MKKAGADLRKLEAVIDALVANQPLSSQLHDHPLSGALAALRECHIAPDWLLIYQRDEESRRLYLVRTGSHSRLFQE